MLIEVNCDFIQEQDKIELKKGIESFVYELSKYLQLDSLQNITLCNDFSNEVTSFQIKHGLRIGYTDNELGVAGAKTISYVEDGLYKVSIFLSPLLTIQLVDENGLFWHTLHHELCHVHEGSISFKMYGDNIEKCFTEYIDKIKFAHAELIWSEYVATRLSVSTVNTKSDIYISMLIESIQQTKEKCRITLDEDEFSNKQKFGEVQLNTSYLFKICSYLLGYLHGLNFKEEEKIQIIDKIFSYEDCDYFKAIFQQIYDELNRLHTLYPNWNGVMELEKLANFVVVMWNEMGIKPNYIEGKLYL